MFKPMKTSDIQQGGATKVLLYAHHGFGKTYQCRFYEKRYGKGFIISGEAGLKSVEDVDIDYLPFTSWDGTHEPDEGVYSFRGICRMISTKEFQEAGYKWIAIDSLTELAQRLMEQLEKENEAKNVSNGFQIWADYGRLMLGSLKWIRDLPIHVLITCLAKEEKDANDVTNYWPHINGQSVAKLVPAMFDHVFCGVRTTTKNDKGMPKVERFIVTDEVNGWHGKTRDPQQRLKPFERCSDITDLLNRMSLPSDEFEKFTNKIKEGEAK